METKTGTETRSAAMDELRSSPTVSIETATQALGVSRAYGYEMAKKGYLPVLKLGPRRVRVRSAALLRMIEGETDCAAS